MNRTSGAVLINGLALIVAVGLANAWLISSRDDGLRAELATAVGTSLPFDARLSGGFLPSDGPAATRSVDATDPDLSPDARIAIAQLEKRAAATPTPETLADAGVAYLVQGDVNRAIATLRDAASQRPRASTLSDLSAAYLAQAGQAPARRIEYLARALEAASRSLQLQPSKEALYNRALALHRLASGVDDDAAWRAFLDVERDPAWVRAATERAGGSPGDDIRDTWEVRARNLRTRLVSADREFVGATAAKYPEATLEHFEREILVAWAQAVERDDRPQIAATLAQARLLADAFATATTDRFLVEEVRRLQAAPSSLARAHLAYAESVTAYDANDYGRARQLAESAASGFAQANSSYAAWARLQTATILFQQGRLPAADSQLASLEHDARRHHRPTLLGRTLWVRGLVFLAQWRLTETLRAFRDAAAQYESAREREYAVSLYHHLADTLRMLGEQHESWEYIGRTLDGLPGVRKPIRRYLFLYNASLFASSQDLLEAALVFQDAAVQEATRAGPEVAIEAITQRAAIYLRRGDRTRAAADLNEAAERLARVSDSYLRQGLDAEVAILRAQADATNAPEALERFRAAVTFFEGAEPARVPRLFLTLARLQMAGAAAADAEATLLSGIERLERQQATLGDESLRISYFDDSWALFQEMVNLQLRTRHDSERAFEFAERARARSLLAAAEGSLAQSRRAKEIQSMLAPSTVLVYYVTLPDRLLIWTISATTFDLIERPISSAELTRLIAQHRDAIAVRQESAVVNAGLYRALIEPVADAIAGHETVAFVPDGELQRLPFATLRHPVSGRYVIEDFTIGIAPSATFFVSASARPGSRSMASALLVGNPEAGGNRALPGAAGEIAGAARFYERYALLEGAEATKERFTRLARDYDVVHFGGHAFANAEYPLLSRLLFAAPAAGGGGESLFAHEIARLRFTRTQLVVLAACSTAAGAVSRGEGIVSAARPFLGAGVPVVVASQWDVDDRATEQLFLEFHHELSRTKNPALALRAAQLAMLRGSNASYSAPASWGGFVALGSTTP